MSSCLINENQLTSTEQIPADFMISLFLYHQFKRDASPSAQHILRSCKCFVWPMQWKYQKNTNTTYVFQQKD